MKGKRQPRLSRKQKPSVVSGTLWILAGLSAIAIVSYWNSFDAPLIFDDLVTIQKNEGVRFGDYFLRPHLFGGRSLLYITFAINHFLHGQEVWGYHFFNLVLHVLNGCAIFLIAAHIFGRTISDPARAVFFAIVAAAVFLTHPVQTESVTYISSRSELLSTLFYALGFLVYIKAPDQRIGFLLSLLILVPFGMGLLSKETTITFPAVLLAYDFVFRSGSQIRPLFSKWRFYITFVVGGVAAGYYMVTRVLGGAIGAQQGHLTPWSYFLTQLRVIVQYVRIVFVPVGLNVDHHVPASYSVFELRVIASGLLLLLIAAAGWYLRRKEPVIALGIFWFFITLSPTSSFVPILDVMFEHRLYLPMVTACMVFPLLLDKGLNLLRTRWEYDLPLKQACFALIGVLIVGTILRNQVWRSDIRLWSDVIAKSPGKSRGYNGLSMAYYKTAQYELALAAAERGLKAIPEESASFYETIGNMSLKLGRYEDAVAAFTESTKIPEKVRQATEYNNIGVSYLFMWHTLRSKQATVSTEYFRSEKARILGLAQKAFLKSIEIQPDTFSALDSYVNVMHDDGRDDQVVLSLQTRFGEDDYRVLYATAKIADWAGDFSRANEYYEKASQLVRNEKLIYFNHAYTLTSMKQTEAAINKYIQALRLDPFFTEANFNLSLLYTERNSFVQALDHLNEILRMDPNHIPAHLQMARVYFREGKRSQALEQCGIVLSLSPGNPEATSVCQQAGF